MISVIFTGGTIGSKINSSGTVSVNDNSAYELLKAYADNYGGDTAFSVSEPYSILSEYLKAEHILLLIDEIKGIIRNDASDGIIITHGTDTLQYTAAILSYVFGSSKIPIVFVSANYILSDKRSNGLINFACAVKFINDVIKNKHGVYVCYKNTGDDVRFHRANRLCAHTEFNDFILSVNNMWYGAYDEDKLSYIDNYDYNEKSDMEAMFWFNDKVSLKNDTGEILRLYPYPGGVLPEIPENIKAVIMGSYHSGTLKVDKELADFLNEAERRQIPVYLTGVSDTENKYESLNEAMSLGIIPLYDLSPIAQYCKMWLAISNGLDIKKTMSTIYAGER